MLWNREKAFGGMPRYAGYTQLFYCQGGAEESPREEYLEVYEEMKKERYFFVEPVEGIGNAIPTGEKSIWWSRRYGILEDSALRKHFPGDRIQGASMHRYRITKPAEDIRAVAFAEDGGIEGIEYGEAMLGIQFHPEIDQSFPGIFQFLTK